MRVVPWDEPGDEAEAPDGDTGTGRLNAMRSWLVSGVHVFVVDPRRRFGRHRRTRELLVVEKPVSHEASERWQTLAAALHRHTVRDGLARLSRAERRIITLAYLEGRTNREIAAMLGVSVTTVRRRLWVALEHLDTFLRRSGAWLAALLLAVLAYANGRLARVGRLAAGPAATDRAHLVAATVAAAAFGVAAVGIVALSQPAAHGGPARTTTITARVGHPVVPLVALPDGPLAPGSVAPKSDTDSVAGGPGDTNDDTGVAPNTKTHSSNGCHGNPTSAPPAVPVGPHHPPGSPVTHPGPGFCKAL